MIKALVKDGKEFSYDKIFEDKNLPEYWLRKYQLAHARWRRYYDMRARSKDNNPMHEVLVERMALIHTKMQWMEHPDFEKETGMKIENPLYMGAYDNLLKQMVKLADQIQKYTEAKPKAVARKETKKLTVTATAKDIKELKDDQLNAAIRELISGEEGAAKEISSGEATEEGPESG
jgi:hypothetical protein